MRISLINLAICIVFSFLSFSNSFGHRDIQFQDITQIAGVGDESWSPASAMVDFDNNGRIDIYLCSKNEPNKLFWNIDGLHFQEVAHRAHIDDSSQSMDCAFGDINNDRCLDLFITNQGQQSRLYLNTGNGTYTNITASSGIDIGYAHSATFSDVERDGDLDLYITHDNSNNWLFFNNGDNTFTDSTNWSGVQGLGATFSCMFSDVNNDTIPDLYIVSRGSGRRNAMYMGIGNGQFIDTTYWSGVQCPNSAGLSALLFDYDNDGDLDLYISNGGSDPDSFYENLGNGQFVNITEHANIVDSSYGRSASCADLNNDGFQDIIVVNYDGKTIIYENNGNGTFSDVTAGSGILYQNDPRGCSTGDIDNDGDIDIYITNAQGSNKLYMNLCDDMNYLKVKLVGTISNSYGIDSKIELFNHSDSLIGYREMKIGKSRLSMNPLIAHFGPAYGEHYRVRVTFPSGIVVDSINVEAAQTITIYEGPPWIEEPVNDLKNTEIKLLCINSNLSPPYYYKLNFPTNTIAKLASLYNASGRKLKTLQIHKKNDHVALIFWDGKQEDKFKVPKGIYFLKVILEDSRGNKSSISTKIIQLD